MNTRELRISALAGLAVALMALSGCTSDVNNVEAAQADVNAKQTALTDAESAFATASDTFCSKTEDYVKALDTYGDILNATAPTVGDVRNAGADLAAPRDGAMDGASNAVATQQAVATAQKELTQAESTLAQLQASPSATPTPISIPDVSLEPLAPEATVDRVKQAEKDFADAAGDINDSTLLSEASEPFHSAAVGLELAWMGLFIDAGCATDAQVKAANAAVTDYVTALQKDLKEAGFYTGDVDGIYGPLTVAAIEDLQKQADLPVTGTIDGPTLDALHDALVKQGKAEDKDELATTVAIQTTLKLLGFYEGPVDGKSSDELTQSIKDFQKALGVKQTGEIDSATIKAFQKAYEALTNPSPSPSPSPSVSPTP